MMGQSVAWNKLANDLNPCNFMTFNLPPQFFQYMDGRRWATIPYDGREGEVKKAVRNFLYMLARKTKQHINLSYGLDWKSGRPHIHGLLRVETDHYRIATYASKKYTALTKDASTIKHASRAYKINKVHQVGGLYEVVPLYTVEDALDILWSDFIPEKYGCIVGYHPDAFSKYITSGGAGSYSFGKHQDGEFVIEVCSTHRNICKKNSGNCAFSWRNLEYVND